MKLNKLFVFITFFLLLTLIAVFGCQNQNLNIKGSESITEASVTQETGTEISDAESTSQENNSDTGTNSENSNSSGDSQGTIEQQPAYLQEFEGLHITGGLIDVDIKTYRLEITGAVDKTLSLTFDEVKSFPSVRIYSELDCPGFFTDKGYWTGVKILDLLDMAGLKENVKRVEFSAVDGSYSKILALEEIQPEDFLIAYKFNDEEFSKYHGYPLRVVAKGLPGNVWVKWLGKIEVLTK